MKHIQKLQKLLLALGIFVGMSMTVQAATEETLLTTVTYTNGGSQTHSTEGVVTVTLNGVTHNDDTYGWLFFDSGTVTVAPVDGVEITKVRFRQNAKTPIDDDLAPFTLTFNGVRGGSVETSTGTVHAGSMDGVTSIEVYSNKTIEEYTVTFKVVNGTWDGTSTADKTETVASGGKPASVPTGMKANSGYTGGSWDTDPSTATISADTTFTYTFVAPSYITITAKADPFTTGTYYATFYDSTTSYVADCEVYYATENADGRFTLEKAEGNVVKAGEGVILKATSETVTLTQTDAAASYDSLLTGSDTETTVENALVLSLGKNGVWFYKYSGTLGANKAYLAQ